MANSQGQMLPNLVYQKGLIVLTTVTLLLGLASLAALYAAQLFTNHHRVALATTNQLQGKMAADGLLQAALQQLDRDPAWRGEFERLPNQPDTQAKVEWTQQDISRTGLTLTLFRLEATSLSADKLRTQKVFADAIRSPLLRNLPRSPLTLPDGLTASTQFELAANPQGLDTKGALSIWSAKEVQFHPNSVTCQQDDFVLQQCAESSISSVHTRSSDIVDSSSPFPDDVFAHLFDFALSEYPYVKGKSLLVVDSCADLNSGSKGMIWIQGDCKVVTNSEIGGPPNPVFLVIESGKLELGSFAKVNGLVLMFDPAQRQPSLLHMQHSSKIVGALVLGEALSKDSKLIRVAYHGEMLNRLQQDPLLQHIVLVAGSWRDYEHQ